MGNKTKEIQTVVLHDPKQTKNDMIMASAPFWQRYLSPNSKTNSWTILQKKIFILILSELKSFDNSNVVVLSNKKVKKELGWNYSNENFRKVGYRLRDELDEMMDSSKLRLQDAITKKWYVGNLIIEAEGNSNYTRVTLNPRFMNHFNDLHYLASKYGQGYFSMLEPDMMELTNNYAHRLFCDLRLQCEVSDKPVFNEVEYEMPVLLKKLGIKESEYIKGANEEKGRKGKFDYYAFEKKVLNVIIDNINGSEQIRFLKYDNGDYFEKTKNGRRIKGYKFKYEVYDNNTIVRNRESLVALAKKHGFEIIYESKENDFLKFNKTLNPKWRITEKKNNEIDSCMQQGKEEVDAIEISDLPPCFDDYEPESRPIDKTKLNNLAETVDLQSQIDYVQDEILKNQRLLKELEEKQSLKKHAVSN